MAYIGKTPASAALTSADISDGIISTAKIADDAATADKIANAVNSAITANTSKTTNATHSGEVTGSGALTIAGNVVDEANLKVSNNPTNGYMLTAQSGNTGGMTWAEAGGGAYEKISTTNVSSATGNVSFNTLSTDYKDFRIVLSNIKCSTHQVEFRSRVKRSGQSSYDSGGSDYMYCTNGRNSNAENINDESTGAAHVMLHSKTLAASGTVGGANLSGNVDWFDVHATDNKKLFLATITFVEGDYGRAAASRAGGLRNSENALIGIQFLFSSGNVQSGKFTLYGRKI